MYRAIKYLLTASAIMKPDAHNSFTFADLANRTELIYCHQVTMAKIPMNYNLFAFVQ